MSLFLVKQRERWEVRPVRLFKLPPLITTQLDTSHFSHHQSGALSLVGIAEIVLSLVETFIELKYFHDVAMP